MSYSVIQTNNLQHFSPPKIMLSWLLFADILHCQDSTRLPSLSSPPDLLCKCELKPST